MASSPTIAIYIHPTSPIKTDNRPIINVLMFDPRQTVFLSAGTTEHSLRLIQFPPHIYLFLHTKKRHLQIVVRVKHTITETFIHILYYLYF